MFAQFISKFHQEESGQDLVEYALVLIAVASGVLAGSTTLSSDFGVWRASLQPKISGFLTKPGSGAGQQLAARRRASILRCCPWPIRTLDAAVARDGVHRS